VVLGDESDGIGVAGAGEVTQLLGSLPELLQVGIVGQRDGRHDGLLSLPAVRDVRPKGGRSADPF